MESSMDVTSQILKSAENIVALTTNVMLLTEDFKREKEIRKELQDDLKSVLTMLQGLGDKISEVGSIKDKIVDLLASQSGLRHDMENMKNAQQGLAILADKTAVNTNFIGKLDERLKSIETRNTRQDGAAGAIRLMTHIFWAVFGAAISGLIVYHFLGNGQVVR